MANEYAPLPTRDPIAVPHPQDQRTPLVEKLPRLVVGDKFVRWFSGLAGEVNARPKRQIHRKLTAQAAAIATTPLAIGTVYEGIWRVSVTVRVTRAATTSSEVRVTISWTEGGVAQSEQTTLLNGNLTSTREGRTFIIRADGSTPISYATSYASVGATTMQYSLDVVAEELALDT